MFRSYILDLGKAFHLHDLEIVYRHCYTFSPCETLSKKKLRLTKTNGNNPWYAIYNPNFLSLRYIHSKALKSKVKPFPFIGDKVGQIEKDSRSYLQNAKSFEKYVGIYKQAFEVSIASGGEKSIERHVKRHGKLLLPDRLKLLLDNTEDFLELSVIGGIGMEYGNIPRANILTGIGKVMGRYCLVVANDGAFKGGSIYPITLKKQLRAQEIAYQNKLPCIYLVDSAGAFLPLQAEIFNLGGSTFYNEAIMSAAKIPQIAIVCGSCTAGGAYVPTMADEAVIVDKTGAIFLGGPPLVQAALGEIVSAENLGGATVHCGTSGCTDYFACTEAEALQMGRDIVASLHVSCTEDLDLEHFDEPVFDPNEIPGLISSSGSHQDINMYQIIACLVDGSRFQEFKAMYGQGLLTGFAHIKGHLVGLLANQGEINEKEASKGAHFIQLCCQRAVPLVFLQNTLSDCPLITKNKNQDVSLGLVLKAQAKMLSAVSCVNVPKITVIIGNGYGSSHYIMGGKAVSPNFLFAWPNARAAIMEPYHLVQAIASETGAENSKETLDKLLEKVHRESSAIFGASRLSNDGIILPQETRKVLSQCLSICKAYRETRSQESPVFRM
uniref:methylcrotonoyl-CoA carboxylase n=1 Tax=Biomphalaria glabrata TaxID=6526 RepID=A0A2C9JRG8_BIOGL